MITAYRHTDRKQGHDLLRSLIHSLARGVPTRPRSAATRDFWAAALLTETREVEESPESVRCGFAVVGGAARDRQRLGALSSGRRDVVAEVEQLSGPGALKIADGRPRVVLRKPSGLDFDVVPPTSRRGVENWTLETLILAGRSTFPHE